MVGLQFVGISETSEKERTKSKMSRANERVSEETGVERVRAEEAGVERVQAETSGGEKETQGEAGRGELEKSEKSDGKKKEKTRGKQGAKGKRQAIPKKLTETETSEMVRFLAYVKTINGAHLKQTSEKPPKCLDKREATLYKETKLPSQTQTRVTFEDVKGNQEMKDTIGEEGNSIQFPADP